MGDSGSVRDELWVWAKICKKKTYLNLIPLSIFWVIWKERNARAFERVEEKYVNIRNW